MKETSQSEQTELDVVVFTKQGAEYFGSEAKDLSKSPQAIVDELNKRLSIAAQTNDVDTKEKLEKQVGDVVARLAKADSKKGDK